MASSSPPTTPLILITGASSGLGLSFFLHFSHHAPNALVLGIDKQPLDNSQRLRIGPAGHFTQLDMTADADTLSAWVREWTWTATESDEPKPMPMPLLVHCAGVRGLVPSVEAAHPHDVAGAETLAVMDAGTMARAYEVNVVGAFQMIRAVLPNLRAAAAAQLRPKAVVLSSRMGSMTANVGGGAYAYRASKAALNAVVRSLSVDVPDVCFACVHPGRVETALVRTREEGAMSCEESLRDMLPLIQRLGEGELKSGCFVDRFGNEIGW